MMQCMKSYEHIKENERELIFLYLHLGKSYREIGKLLGRNHGTIVREVKRNQAEVGTYSAMNAQSKAEQRRAQSKLRIRKLASPTLAHYVIRRIGQGWSPETIEGRLKTVESQHTVSHETIYQFIYQKEQKRLKLFELLKRQHRKRRLMHGRKTNKKGMIPNRIFIDKRPDSINQRQEVGHWETDLMEGPKKTAAHVSVVVERKSRVTKLVKVHTKQATEKTDGLCKQLGRLPNRVVKSITFDNGKENAEHQLIASQLKCKTYFCHPYHSWEKGTVENTIGLVRQYLPKKMNLEEVTQGELSWIADQLNNRPRKVLGYKTPSEVFTQMTSWCI
jgi:transposase, IS30 family